MAALISFSVGEKTSQLVVKEKGLQRRTPPFPPPSIDQVWRDNAILTGTLIILVSLLVGAGVACRCYEVSGVWALAASILLAKPES